MNDIRTSVVDAWKDRGDVRHGIEDVECGLPEESATVTGEIGEERRDTLRQMHTAPHVDSQVVLDEFDAATAGRQIDEDRSRSASSPTT